MIFCNKDHEGPQSVGPYSDTILRIMVYVFGAFNLLEPEFYI
jgi:hypothetical protein